MFVYLENRISMCARQKNFALLLFALFATASL